MNTGGNKTRISSEEGILLDETFSWNNLMVLKKKKKRKSKFSIYFLKASSFSK
jgi:hypothetical protein